MGTYDKAILTCALIVTVTVLLLGILYTIFLVYLKYQKKQYWTELKVYQLVFLQNEMATFLTHSDECIHLTEKNEKDLNHDYVMASDQITNDFRLNYKITEHKLLLKCLVKNNQIIHQIIYNHDDVLDDLKLSLNKLKHLAYKDFNKTRMNLEKKGMQ